RLFNYLVGGNEHLVRDRDAERLGGLEVDDQREFGWLHDRQIGRLLALEDAAAVDAHQACRVCKIASVAYQAACGDELAIEGNRGHCVAQRWAANCRGVALY